MASSKLITVDSLIESWVITGIEHQEKGQEAFLQYCRSEYGELAGRSPDEFAGLSISGKGDKAKGKLQRGTIEFKGGHSRATAIISAACAIKKIADSTGMVIGKVDASEVCQAWFEDWSKKQIAKGKVVAPAKLEKTEVGTFLEGAEVSLEEASNVEA